MSRADYGRAFQIRSRDVKSYDRTKSYRRNPMGVTTLAKVNGRGAYSARTAARGQSKKQRIAAARKLLNNGGKMQKRGRRASFVSNAPSGAKKRGKRLAAFNAARKRGLTKNAAGRSALRTVPWTATERRQGASFQGMTANPKRKATKKRSAKNPAGRRKTKSPKRRLKRNPTAAQYEKEVRTRRATKSSNPKSRKTKRAAPKRKTKKVKRASEYRTVKKTVTKRVRYKIGKYKRARLTNPRTGRVQYSYMYKTKGGKLRRIPTSAVVGKKEGGANKVRKGRVKAARRLIKSGGAFVANKSSRARRRAAEKGRLVRKGYGKAKAARAALRKFPWTEVEKRAGKRLTKAGKIIKARGGTKKSRKGRKTKKRKTTKRKGGKMTKAKRRAAALKGWRKRRRGSTKRGSTKRGSTKRKASAKRKGGKMTKAKRRAAALKGWRRRRRSGGGRRYKKNADRFAAFMTTTALVGVGVLLHRGVVAGICLLITGNTAGEAETAAPAAGVGRFRRRRSMRGLGQTNGSGMTKPAVATGVAVIGSIASVWVGGDSGTVVAAGMIGSALGQVLVFGLKAAGQTELAAALGGYSNSMAYSLRGNRRGIRGLGGARSTLPRYQPVGAFSQAAAGTHNPNSLGEYYQPNSLGEYFAPANLQGVGAYEPAGQMAMQASAGTGQIDDGIRPDSNLDRVLDLAESAAGLRGMGAAKFAQAMAGRPGGIGEYVTAQPSNGGYVEQRVPTSSQWIPNGPLWGGTLGVTGDTQTSEIPAGILAGPGGNGILSGG